MTDGRTRSWQRGRLLSVSLLLFELLLVVPSCRSDEVRLLSGQALQDALIQRRSMSVVGRPFSSAAEDLQKQLRISIVIDRRIDPSTSTELQTDYVTTRDVLHQLAVSLGPHDASFGRHYVYIGPSVASQRLRTLAALRQQDVQSLRRSLDTETFRLLVTAVPASWPDLSEPRQLITEAAAKAGVTIANPEAIPHDLWRGAALPALPFTDYATLVLNQIDLTFELTADGTVTLIPLPEIVVIEQRHRVSLRDREGVEGRWKAAFPELDVQWKGSTAVVEATVEIHEELEQLSRGAGTEMIQVAGIRDRLFTMKAPAGTTFGRLIDTFRRSGVPIRTDGWPDTELQRLMSGTVAFDHERLPGREFFPKIFADWPGTITVTDSEVVLHAP